LTGDRGPAGKRQPGDRAWDSNGKLSLVIRQLTHADAVDAERLIDDVLGGRTQARLDEVIDVLALPGYGAWADSRLVGIATYSINGPDAEIAALGVTESHRGEGLARQLLDAVITETSEHGVDRVWVVTTNDNLTALAVYQRHGFRLVEIHPGAIDRARALKPTIPEIGQNGIPMHDEIVLERQGTRPASAPHT
jgi:ribosomal protein S18 acetylase RimI-like enzyme